MYSGNLGFAHNLDLLPGLIALLRDVDVEYRFIGSGRKILMGSPRGGGEPRVTFGEYVDVAQHSDTLACAIVSRCPVVAHGG